MPLNKASGNMYEFVDATWNPLAGECPHDCIYCYMKTLKEKYENLATKYSGDPRLLESEMRTNLYSKGVGIFIFVGNCVDLFAEKVSSNAIEMILDHCKAFPQNRYLFQTKNPKRFREFITEFPPDTILGITLETDSWTFRNQFKRLSSEECPEPGLRVMQFRDVEFPTKMINHEPLYDFNPTRLFNQVMEIELRDQLEFISIGSETKGHHAPEPSGTKVVEYIETLKKHRIDVHTKRNLRGIAHSQGRRK